MRFVLFLLVLFPLAHALTPGDVATFYAETSEKATANSFPHDGELFYLVKINGQESAIFGMANGVYYTVEDDAQLRELLQSYVTSSRSGAKKELNATALNASFSTLNASLGKCVLGLELFQRTKGVGSAYYIVSRTGSFNSAICPRIATSGTSIDANARFLKMNASMYDFIVNTRELARSLPSLLQKAQAGGEVDREFLLVRDVLDSVSRSYVNVSEGYSAIRSYCPYAFGALYSCPSADQFNAQVGSVFAQFGVGEQNVDVLFARVKSQTISRGARAEIRKLTYVHQLEYANATARSNAIVDGYARFNRVEFIALNSKMNSLKNLMTSIQDSNSVQDSQQAEKTFSVRYKSVLELFDYYEAVFPTYQRAALALANASESVTQAEARLGIEDGRSKELRRQFATLETAYSGKETDLSIGTMFEASEFEGLEREAISLNERANAAGNGFLDQYGIIIAFILMVAIAAAAFFFLRKRMGGTLGVPAFRLPRLPSVFKK